MLKKIGLGFSIFIVVIYALFLTLPLFLSGILNAKSGEISKMVEDSTGFKLNLENIRLVTTPKLSVGVKVSHLKAALPTGEEFVTADNVHGELSLIPVVLRRIEADKIGAQNLNINVKIKKDGKFLIEDFLPKEDESKQENITVSELPFGFKLSNKLPDIRVRNYNISFIDIPTDNSYSIYGDNFSITDFIINKKIRISSDGKVLLKDREQFSYDINVLNKIMPDIDLNEILFAQNQENSVDQEPLKLNLIDIFKAIYENQLTADIKSKMTVSGDINNINLSGNTNISNFSLAVDNKKLPAGEVNLKMKGDKISLYSKLFTSEKEITELTGEFKTGKHPVVDLNCKSNAKFKSLFDIADSVAKTFGYNQLDTLTATGGIDADFSVKSDFKKVVSSGYLKIPSASISYKLYNIVIEKIFADVQFADNTVNIKDSGLSILGHPLTIKGSISNDAVADLSIFADKLQIKGLLLAAGQMALLKDNQINSGDITLNVLLKGKLDSIIPKILVYLNNVNIKNIPSNTVLTLENSIIDITSDGKITNGKINFKNAKILNPLANLLVPNVNVLLGEKDIDINNTYVMLNNSRIDIIGKIADYMSKNLNMDVTAKGNILANDIKSLIPKDFISEFSAKGTLPLYVQITGSDKSQNIFAKINADSANYLSAFNIEQLKGKNTEIRTTIKLNGDNLKLEDTGVYANGTLVGSLKGIVNDLYKTQNLSLHLALPSNINMSVPFMKNSKMTIGGNVDVSGAALNPNLKGILSIPLISIPDMLLTMKDMTVNLNGPIVSGKGTLKSFVSGGIVAEDLSSDFNLVNNVFYLKNLEGKSFDGKVNGNISYNILNGLTGVELNGTSMNAESAIAGAAGIKNALTGKLNFSAKVTTYGDTETLLMKNLKGNASFDISDGVFGNIGRFDNLLLAQNIMSNPILKAGVNSIRTLSVVRDTANFKTINGNLKFQNGWADLSPIKTSGPSMAYYITGKYNLLNGTANLIILGRISAEVVKLLGPLGDLSLSKLTSFIPGIGAATSKLVLAVTTSPYGEKVSEIPNLTSDNSNYKDFKVQFNGGVESSSSVKSFRWLSVCDTSEIDSFKVKDQVQAAKEAMQDVKNKQIEAYNQQMAEKRKQAQDASKELKNAAEGLKNLFKTSQSSSAKSGGSVKESSTEANVDTSTNSGGIKQEGNAKAAPDTATESNEQ